MHSKQIKLSNVWRTCNKIRAAVFRVGINLWEYYLPLDPHKNCVISEAQFLSVLTGPLQTTIGLCEQEICELADYFRLQDGRILYTQFCDVVQKNAPDFTRNAPMITGLEWEDPLQVNPITPAELRRLRLLITKIACHVNKRRLILRPYFQDYELISKNTGAVTIAHFGRILAYLGITLATEEFRLILKRFIKDSYTVNYIAFVATVDEVIEFMNKHGIVDLGGDLLDQFPERIITAELPKLPRPEVGSRLLSDVTGKQDNFHPSLEKPVKNDNLRTVLLRIQKYITENRIMVDQFFRDFDAFKSGRVTISQFERGLDSLGINSMGRLYLHPEEIKLIIRQYRDRVDPQRVYWKTFENDVTMGLVRHCLHKHPTFVPEVPPKELRDVPNKGVKPWGTVPPHQRDLCEAVIQKIKQKVTNRRISLKPAFTNFDSVGRGHLTRNEMRRVFVSQSILLAEEELCALENRFNDVMGFNYQLFLRELDSVVHDTSMHETFMAERIKVNQPIPKTPSRAKDKDMVAILGKIKGKVVSERVNILEFLKPYDPLNEFIITRENFTRAIAQCRFDLNEYEVETIMNLFAAPMRTRFVDYKRFCEVVEQALVQLDLERAPLLVPIQHVPSQDSERNFLNFTERQLISTVLHKLAKFPEFVINLNDIFQDYDKSNSGRVSPAQVMKALSQRGMHTAISSAEFETLCKCFNYPRGYGDSVDYRALCRAIDIVYYTRKQF